MSEYMKLFDRLCIVVNDAQARERKIDEEKAALEKLSLELINRKRQLGLDKEALRLVFENCSALQKELNTVFEKRSIELIGLKRQLGLEKEELRVVFEKSTAL